ncbi:bifunctional aconitate hydratase 2/2-methylisocitrate dehydratase [Entomohabitans teleogrylli]|uniref:bifunctional aconitate hydratase 2/2-methylisocitrate dehydratase n=1 Tax=Entomohabitans teleogrylli TaxID=1384589 RepID=UPI00073D7107|nr:bifunctional aconitate hydratase 2/2-methylisocitrate dehydratase [Entomohabitans teleogrylli]
MLTEYRRAAAQREAQGIPPAPLNAEQTRALTALLQTPPSGEEAFILNLFSQRVPPGVDEAAQVKAEFLAHLTRGELSSPLIDARQAIELLGTMLGGYNVQPLIDALDNPRLAPDAVKALSHTLLIFDNFSRIEAKARQGNGHAHAVLEAWARADWFITRCPLPEKLTVTVFKVPGETNTDDLSPAPEAWSRPDIPLHALAMLKIPRDGIEPDEPGKVGPLRQVNELKKKGYPLAYVGDVVGTGSSRKSATNSLQWYMGNDIPAVPNKRSGGVVLAGKIAPIFFNTLEDGGALPIEMDVSRLNSGDVIDIWPLRGEVCRHGESEPIATFNLKTDVLLDEVRAGGRIPLIIGRHLTARARKALEMPEGLLFRQSSPPEYQKGFTLAQKIVGRACGLAGVRPGQYCEPRIHSVGSQDTTGTMTRDELKDLACLSFSAPLVMQSFCHTSAYPKPVDLTMQQTLPDFFTARGGIALRPGDGIIHSWLNRMILPDTVGTGGDSHTRFPVGISFPAGSGLVAFAAATGVMPLDMPESVLVRFYGEMQPGITLRDLVHAIPYFAIKAGLLTVEKQGKKNIFSGRILEIEGLPHLKVEQAFELADASAERSASGCTIRLDKAPVEEYLRSNVTLLKWLIAEGYQNRETLERRIGEMELWLANPQLLERDEDAEYAAVLEIDLAQINEPILCVPNDPDDVRLLSEVAGRKIDEVFIGSCMTNIGHFRAAGKLLAQNRKALPCKLWLAPPTRMDAQQLEQEAYYAIYQRSGVRTEPPGCSLCMGNQARVAEGATVVSTSTRNFPNRLGTGAQVYLASAELAAVAAIGGHLPTVEQYHQAMAGVNAEQADTYRYLNFDRIETYIKKAEEV